MYYSMTTRPNIPLHPAKDVGTTPYHKGQVNKELPIYDLQVNNSAILLKYFVKTILKLVYQYLNDFSCVDF